MIFCRQKPQYPNDEVLLTLSPDDNTMSVSTSTLSDSSALTWAPQAALANRKFSYCKPFFEKKKLTLIIEVIQVDIMIDIDWWRAWCDYTILILGQSKLISIIFRKFVIRIAFGFGCAVRFGYAFGFNEDGVLWRGHWASRLRMSGYFVLWWVFGFTF